jgi:FixJ family two-component response regulator
MLPEQTTAPTDPTIDEERFVAIVDDDASVRRSARRLIRAFGYRAEAFGSAEEFLHSGDVKSTACLILDVRMPRMDGLELQRRLDGSAIPIVFITARASEEEERRALRAGAVAFLRKPVDKQALLRVLGAVLETSESDGGRP